MNIFLVITLVVTLLSFVLTVFRDVGLEMIFNPDALFIVVGGSLIAVFIGFPFKRIGDTVQDVISAFKADRDRDAVVKDILEMAKIYRKADIRGLENRMKSLNDDFLRFGINLLINHRSSEEIRTIMEREMAIRVMHYNFSQNVMKTVARLTPSFGLAGTVISLIKMFKHFQSVDMMAPLMAVALMSTFYGVVISNLFMLPLCAKIKDKAIASETLMNIIIEGMEAINNGEHPYRIEEKIKGHLSIEEFCFSGAGTPLAAAKGVN
ncbi:MAG: MotA/TolQ/ExbB proton channel family protein [Nitrospirae bacterium]|nr:MotA/TolQ/ExbB proton channel family protein [Nitrospirota bacterium]